jgi:hypothetical protein
VGEVGPGEVGTRQAGVVEDGDVEHGVRKVGGEEVRAHRDYTSEVGRLVGSLMRALTVGAVDLGLAGHALYLAVATVIGLAWSSRRLGARILG